jgi:Flp pilus assembly protein TadG
VAAVTRALRCAHDDRGVAAVEFALVAPLLFAVIAFGMSMLIGMTRQSELQRVAELAARAASVPVDVTNAGRGFRSQAEIESAVRATSTGGFDTLALTNVDGAPLDPTSVPEGQPFDVVVTVTWRNPLARLVNLVGTGITGEANTITARAVGVRE